MPATLFSASAIEQSAFPAVLKAGQALFNDSRWLKSLRIVGSDIIAVYKGRPERTTVVSTDGSGRVQSVCTCGYKYGGACEHAVAAMLAANSRTVIPVGLDLGMERLPGDRPDDSAQAADGEPVEDIMAAEDAPDIQAVETVGGTPVGRVYLSEQDRSLLAELRFAYLDGETEFPARNNITEPLVRRPDGSIVKLRRSRAVEMSLTSALQAGGLAYYGFGSYTPEGDPVEWIREGLPRLAGQGFEIYGQESIGLIRSLQVKPSLRFAATSIGESIRCTMQFSYGEVPAELRRVFEAVIHGEVFVRLADGTTGEIPEEWMRRLTVVFGLCEKQPEGDTVDMRRASIEALDLLDSIADSAQWDRVCAEARGRLKNFSGVAAGPVPAGLCATLRDYQKTGYDWLRFLQELRIGGCLADDMGLGKTVQTIALLLSEKERGASPGTSLLVVPASLLFNWVRETRAFGPSLRVLLYHGPERKRYGPAEMAFADIVLTTYGTLHRDIGLFEKIRFNYAVLDEAQAVKNPLSHASKTVRRINSVCRLALSGTPFENSLSELWSLFTFLNPGMLGSYRRFMTVFGRPVEQERNELKASLLRKLIRPCILRRTKSQVAKELPPKTEQVIVSAMTPRQKTLYDITAETGRAIVQRIIEQEGLEKSSLQVLAALTRLRQVCCHPKILDPAYDGSSGKFEALDRLLENVTAEGHKALVFSSFVSVLDLVRDRLASRKIPCELLTGRTADRSKPVDRFQSDPAIPVMLISLKAGGTGLNLTAADYVIIMDPWWNPAAELQAAGRAYRIGQTKPVFVYKLVTEQSVEERILDLQKHKRDLFDAVISAETTVFKNLSRAEVLGLFGEGNSGVTG